jgi:phosphoglycerate dehydrogenase-like enzyme
MKAVFCLDVGPFKDIYGEELREEIGQLVDLDATVYSAENIREHPEILVNVDLIFSGWGAPVFTGDVLAQAPNLKAVFYGAGSVKYFVTDEFWQRGIQVTSAYAKNAVPVVEYSLAAVLLSLRGFWLQAALTKAERAFKRTPLAGTHGSTVGLVSLGMIGKMMVERLATYEVNIIAYDPYVPQYPGVDMVTLEEVFKRSDVVSVHTPWLKETEGLIGGMLFEKMKPYSTFINTSRGAIVNEAEMCSVLAARPDLTAILDVTYPEPPLPESALYTLHNVILTPHIGGSVGSECRRMGKLMVEELKRFLAGEPLMYGLSKERVAIMA